MVFEFPPNTNKSQKFKGDSFDKQCSKLNGRMQVTISDHSGKQDVAAWVALHDHDVQQFQVVQKNLVVRADHCELQQRPNQLQDRPHHFA